jgi:hypothetical protein
MTLVAPTYGFSAQIDYFPEPNDSNLIAKVSLNKGEKFEPELFTYIKKRHTNRKAYKKIPLNNEQKQKFLDLFKPDDPVTVCLIEAPEISKASTAICQGDRMIFENEAIHNFLFDHIRWTEKDELACKNGLYLKTMELNPPQRMFFRIFKKWKVMKIFNSIGFPKLAVKSNFTLYKNSSAIVALLVKDHEPTTYLELGRSLQRFWLTASSLNLNLHPLTAIPFLHQRIVENHTHALKNYQVDIIKESYSKLSEICKTKDRAIAFMFRLGQAGPPSGLSSRLSPEIEIKK